MTSPLLLIEDGPAGNASHFASLLSASGYSVACANADGDALRTFERIKPEFVVLDMAGENAGSLGLMQQCLSVRPTTRFLVLTHESRIDCMTDAMRAGARTVLMRPFHEERFLDAISDLTKADPVSATDNSILNRLVGRSAAMIRIRTVLPRIAKTDANVFLSGASGTGKTHCAEILHQLSERAERPFVTVPCASLNYEDITLASEADLQCLPRRAEDTLTRAATDARGGTVFLNGVSDLGLEAQTRLLAFLQTAAREADIRIISASQRDPHGELAAGRMLEELFYRLNVVPIHLPRLCNRKEDVLDIAEAMIAEICAAEELEPIVLTKNAKAALLQNEWPGNVRQLGNAIRHAMLMNHGPQIDSADLHLDGLAPSSPDCGSTLAPLVGKSLAEIEQIVIEATIARAGGSVPKAARLLDVSPSTLYRKRDTWSKDCAPARH